MQTLALQLTTTLVDEAIELVAGFGRAIFALAMAPIERIARACDVAGVLEQRRADRRAPRPAAQRGSWRKSRRCRWSPFGGLSDLT
ncbi:MULTISPECIES: hypothetical protein [unclassified Bradyrhizobium]|uniref:hypothetical protein n=1 Tax=unclassified Bradyrhizobium TaxID=2631580 RepID=UPI001BA52E3A|nr:MULTISPECIES: hypothetical protein [unclassified Bradyrhizobium]MBR1204944.1 hypothetical protein [Bradyrhizobium sp. AUGA SZCCT0124]MBR1312030.1 hypothetical protein [Bradyrhizobium sp. AUGA SZCCT0051]MBR1343760.1 hypothetical protein [Bradyrhizobium sp. AUGA SZCCT0105]MBR1358301.1 hypothetical protein [Bradyrhizobium sp. AUGA SZCCT0045]